MIDMIETGKIINAYIRSNGYTREKIAKELGISCNSVYKWLNGGSIPSIDHLVTLSKLFECTIDDLIAIKEIF